MTYLQGDAGLLSVGSLGPLCTLISTGRSELSNAARATVAARELLWSVASSSSELDAAQEHNLNLRCLARRTDEAIRCRANDFTVRISRPKLHRAPAGR